MDAIRKYYCNGFVFDATGFVKTPCGYLISETDRRHARASQLANRVPLSFPLWAGL